MTLSPHALGPRQSSKPPNAMPSSPKANVTAVFRSFAVFVGESEGVVPYGFFRYRRVRFEKPFTPYFIGVVCATPQRLSERRRTTPQWLVAQNCRLAFSRRLSLNGMVRR
jgi:hypothetical protein